MMALLTLKDKIKNIYAEHELVINPIIKFIEAFIALVIIKFNIGYMPLLNLWIVVLAIAVICAFLPWSMDIIILAIVIAANIFSVSIEVGAFISILMVLMVIFFFRFTPEQGMFLVLVPLAFFLKIPYIIPIAAGLLFSPIAIVSVSCGTVIYYLLSATSANATAITNIASGSDKTTTINSVINMIGHNNEMILTIVAFALTTAIVYGIKRQAMDNSWIIAILAGGVTDFIIILIGNIVLNTNKSIALLIIGTIFSLLLAFILQFFVFSVDYTRTEHTQFEDDEYYYYVKAVPKINVTAPEMNVKRINAQRRRKGMNKASKTSRKK